MNYELNNEFYIRIPRLSIDYYDAITDMSDNEIYNYILSNYKEEILSASEDTYLSLIYKKGDIYKITISVYKYLVRFMSRTTPFGLESSVLIGHFSNTTEKKIDYNNFYKKVKIDYGWYIKVIKKLEQLIDYDLLITVNNTINIVGNSIINNWIDGYYSNEKFEDNIIVSKTKPVELIISYLNNSYVRINEIIDILKQNYIDVPEEILHKFVWNLIENEVLISNLKTCTLNDMTINNLLISINQEYNLQLPIVEKLNKVNNLINEYESMKIGQGDSKLYEIKEYMKGIMDYKNDLAIDMYNSDKVVLSIYLRKEIENFIEFLNIFSNHYTYEEEYYNKFIEKFGYQAVNINEVFDEVKGIGYPIRKSSENEYLKFIDEYMTNCNTSEIDLVNISGLRKKEIISTNLSAFEIAFEIYQKDNKFFYKTTPLVGSDAPFKALGRFKEFQNITKKNAIKHNTDTVEITYSPKINKVGNVANCNTNCDYILEYGTKDINHKDKSICLSDIYIAPVNGKLCLINEKNSNFLEFYVSNMASLSFMPKILQSILIISDSDKENNFNLYTYLFKKMDGWSVRPRILYKNFIISSLSLKFDFNNCDHNNYENFKKMVTERVKKIIKEDIVLCGLGDNFLLLNISKERDMHILYKMFLQNKVLLIKEQLYKNNSIIKDIDNNHYISEFVFPVIPKMLNLERNKYHGKFKKDIIDDLEWISYRIYMDSNVFDEVIINYISPLVKKLMDEKRIKQYFYIKYIDEKYHHLRLRLNISNDSEGCIYSLIRRMTYELKNKNIIKSLILDEYYPEINRYGGEKNIHNLEKIFYYSSKIAFSEIEEKINLNDSLYLQKSFYITIVEILMGIYDNYSSILGLLNIYDKYKDKSNKCDELRRFYIKKIIWQDISQSSINTLYNKITKRHRKDIQLIIDKLRFVILDNNYSIKEKNEIILSIFHMHFNRLMGVNRKNENIVMGNIESLFFSLNHISERRQK